MKTITQHLTHYAHYHRDRRNIATHFVGIPLIVLGVAGLLSRPALLAGGVPLSAALLVTLGAIVFYLALDPRYGIAMTAFMGLSVWAGAHMAAQSTVTWLGLALSAFVLGWVIQFIGHAFEGKKPAFVDDLVGLLIGPLFIVAEAGFALGLRNDLGEAIEAEAGPTLIRPRRGSAPFRA